MAELVFGRICGGAGGDTLVFLPAERAQELAAIHFAIATATTWRQFSRIIPAQDWHAALQGFSNYEAPVYLDAEFDSAMLPGFEDGDWPDWPEQSMMRWLPGEVWRKYAVVHQSVINGPFLSFDPKLEAKIVEALEAVGFACQRDNALVVWACGKADPAKRLAIEILQYPC